MPAKSTELDNMNRLRVEAEREVARLREVLLLIASSSPDKATRLEARRALAKDSRVVGGTLPPSTDSAGWCRVCGHGNDRLGKLHLSNCPSKPAGVAMPRGGGQ